MPRACAGPVGPSSARPPRTKTALLGVALCALLGVWWLVPATGVPLYDGICLSAPYKYLGGAPPGIVNGGSPGQDVKTDTAFVSADTLELNTNDNNLGPAQAQVIAGPATLDLTGPITLHASLMPIGPPTAPPAKGYVIGNVYQVAVSDSAGHPVQVKPGRDVSLYLLPPKAVRGTTIQRLDGDHWTVLSTTTTPSCTNTITANSNRFGTFAMVDPNPPPAGGGPSVVGSPGAPPWALPAAIAGTLLVFGSLVTMVRRRRRTPSS